MIQQNQLCQSIKQQTSKTLKNSFIKNEQSPQKYNSQIKTLRFVDKFVPPKQVNDNISDYNFTDQSDLVIQLEQQKSPNQSNKYAQNRIVSLQDSNNQIQQIFYNAVNSFQVDVIENLLSLYGLDTFACDDESNNPLHICMFNFSQDIYLSSKIAQLLLDYGANPNQKNGEGWCPLHIAARKGSLSAIKFAVAYNIQIIQRNIELQQAKKQENSKNRLRNLFENEDKYNNTDQNKALINTNNQKNNQNLFNLNKKGGPEKWSLLHIAANLGHPTMLEFLYLINYDMTIQNLFGEYAKQVSNQCLILRKLLKKYEIHWINGIVLSSDSIQIDKGQFNYSQVMNQISSIPCSNISECQLQLQTKNMINEKYSTYDIKHLIEQTMKKKNNFFSTYDFSSLQEKDNLSQSQNKMNNFQRNCSCSSIFKNSANIQKDSDTNGHQIYYNDNQQSNQSISQQICDNKYKKVLFYKTQNIDLNRNECNVVYSEQRKENEDDFALDLEIDSKKEDNPEQIRKLTSSRSSKQLIHQKFFIQSQQKGSLKRPISSRSYLQQNQKVLQKKEPISQNNNNDNIYTKNQKNEINKSDLLKILNNIYNDTEQIDTQQEDFQQSDQNIKQLNQKQEFQIPSNQILNYQQQEFVNSKPESNQNVQNLTLDMLINEISNIKTKIISLTTLDEIQSQSSSSFYHKQPQPQQLQKQLLLNNSLQQNQNININSNYISNNTQFDTQQLSSFPSSRSNQNENLSNNQDGMNNHQLQNQSRLQEILKLINYLHLIHLKLVNLDNIHFQSEILPIEIYILSEFLKFNQHSQQFKELQIKKQSIIPDILLEIFDHILLTIRNSSYYYGEQKNVQSFYSQNSFENNNKQSANKFFNLNQHYQSSSILNKFPKENNQISQNFSDNSSTAYSSHSSTLLFTNNNNKLNSMTIDSNYKNQSKSQYFNQNQGENKKSNLNKIPSQNSEYIQDSICSDDEFQINNQQISANELFECLNRIFQFFKSEGSKNLQKRILKAIQFQVKSSQQQFETNEPLMVRDRSRSFSPFNFLQSINQKENIPLNSKNQNEQNNKRDRSLSQGKQNNFTVKQQYVNCHKHMHYSEKILFDFESVQTYLYLQTNFEQNLYQTNNNREIASIQPQPSTKFVINRFQIQEKENLLRQSKSAINSPKERSFDNSSHDSHANDITQKLIPSKSFQKLSQYKSSVLKQMKSSTNIIENFKAKCYSQRSLQNTQANLIENKRKILENQSKFQFIQRDSADRKKKLFQNYQKFTENSTNQSQRFNMDNQISDIDNSFANICQSQSSVNLQFVQQSNLENQYFNPQSEQQEFQLSNNSQSAYQINSFTMKNKKLLNNYNQQIDNQMN